MIANGTLVRIVATLTSRGDHLQDTYVTGGNARG
jgi:hypothetical protein